MTHRRDGSKRNGGFGNLPTVHSGGVHIGKVLRLQPAQQSCLRADIIFTASIQTDNEKCPALVEVTTEAQ